MEREKNERLTKEIEEEKMKHELTDVGMYEQGMTYNEMKLFLEAINESKQPTSASNNKNIQKESQHCNKESLSETTPDANESKQAASLQEANTEASRPSFSYKLNRTSPTMHERKIRYSNSPESPSSFTEIRNKRKSSDSDEIFEAQLPENANTKHNANRFFLSRSGSSLRECQNVTEKRAAQDTQRELLERKLERWRLNPLNVTVNEKDVPLRQPNRPQAQERVPFRYCKEAHTSEEHDRVMRAVSQHLKEMAELWYTWQPATYSIFQWGSPIQVGTANGSLDRKPLIDSKAEQIKAECTYRNSHERASKRKANSLIVQYRKESSTEDEGDDDKFTDFARIKKKKIQSGNKMSNAERAANQHTHSSHEKATASTISHQRSSNDDNNDPTPKNTRRKRKTAEEKERSPELSPYPRRIVPPVPKARLSLFRNRKESAASKLSQQVQSADKIIEQTKNQQKNKAMTAEEISETLLHDWPSSEDESAVAKDVEIRPLPISTSVQLKLQQKRFTLKKIETTTEPSVSLVTITKKSDDQERGKEMGLKLYEQQRRKENYNRIENRNGKWEDDLSNHETKLSERIQAPEVRNGNHSDDVSTSSNKVKCPICNKLFPDDEIENHAANCEQFDTNDESNDNNQLECTICSNYKTHKMAEYEEHVDQCIKKNDGRRSHESEDIDTAPTSSFSTFKPISEQEDSEIDYLALKP